MLHATFSHGDPPDVVSVPAEEPVEVDPEQELGEVRALLVVAKGRQQLEQEAGLTAKGKADLEGKGD